MSQPYRRAMPIVLMMSLSTWACGDDGNGPEGLQPTVLGIAPDSGNVGTQVAITGSSFEAGPSVTFGDVESDSVVFVDGSSVLAYAPEGIVLGSVYDVSLRNAGGKSDRAAGAFKAVGPVLQVVNGVSKPSGNTGTPVILEGKSFGDLRSVGQAFFTDGAGQPVEASIALPENWTDEFILTAVPASAETGPLWIETPLGATDSIEFRVTQSALFSPSLITWTETQAMPGPAQGHGAVFLSIEDGPGAGNLVWVTGGADGAGTAMDAVVFSEVGAGGELGAYTNSTPLPAPRAFHGAALATPFNALIDTLVAGHVYAIGGIDENGDPTATVYTAAVGKDRALTAWTETTSLPEPLHSMGVTIYRSWLYVVGGASTGNAPTASVYRARINMDGSLGEWEGQAPLPYPRAYAPLVVFAGALYVLGGDSAAVAPGDNTLTSTRVNQIHHVPLNLRTGELSDPAWSLNPNTLIKTVSKHSAVVAGGTVLVSGGVYSGASNSSTEQQYSEFKPDGTLGTFNGATGSHTIAGSSGAGGAPFFNHRAIGYVDASGVAHVVILGGNNVADPTQPVANTYYY